MTYSIETFFVNGNLYVEVLELWFLTLVPSGCFRTGWRIFFGKRCSAPRLVHLVVWCRVLPIKLMLLLGTLNTSSLLVLLHLRSLLLLHLLHLLLPLLITLVLLLGHLLLLLEHLLLLLHLYVLSTSIVLGLLLLHLLLHLHHLLLLSQLCLLIMGLCLVWLLDRLVLHAVTLWLWILLRLHLLRWNVVRLSCREGSIVYWRLVTHF